MNMDSLNKWLTLAANIGVVIGIVFLGIELSQNRVELEDLNTQNRLTARGASGEAVNGFRQLLLENPNLLSVWSRATAGENLSTEEFIQFGYLCSFELWSRLNVVVRMDALGLEVELDRGIKSIRQRVNFSDIYRDCWDNQKDAFMDLGYEEIARRIDQ